MSSSSPRAGATVVSSEDPSGCVSETTTRGTAYARCSRSQPKLSVPRSTQEDRAKTLDHRTGERIQALDEVGEARGASRDAARGGRIASRVQPGQAGVILGEAQRPWGGRAHLRGGTRYRWRGGRAATGRPRRPGYQADQRPGQGRPVLHDRVDAGFAGRGARPGPVRGIGRGRPRGPVPRRGARAAGGARGPGHARDQGEHRGDRPARCRARRRPGGAGAGPRVLREAGTTWCSPTRRTRWRTPPCRRSCRCSPGQGWLAPGALVIVERATRSGPLNWPDGFVPDRSRRYGEATFWYGLARRARRPRRAQRPRTMIRPVLEHGRRAGGESLRATRSLSGIL